MQKYDVIEKIKNSTIQHGRFNDRIYLMKLAKQDYPEIVKDLDKLATEKTYSKIFAKIPVWALEPFKNNHYIEEARIPKFFNGTEDCCFLSKYIDDKRKIVSPDVLEEIQRNIDTAIEKRDQPSSDDAPVIKKLTEKDCSSIAMLYGKVFKSYPFPIFDKTYIEETMRSHIDYFGIYDGDNLIAASSSEVDKENANSEMTDFAVLPEYRGKHLAVFLLQEMEKAAVQMKLKTVYTIARAMSAGMNITFSKLGYNFAGTLTNNTQISGKIESMNVWYKNI